MNKMTIRDLDLNNKKVLMRVDFNVPMQNGEITDVNRIIQAVPTIKLALEKGAKLVLFSHLGRVKSEDDLSKTLKPVAVKLAEELGQEVTFVPETRGEALEAAINNLSAGEVVMFENTRFEDLNNKAESKNDPELGKYWASLGEVFINDAFGTAHRAHASNVGIAENIETSAVGLLLEKEIEILGNTVANPERPFVAILGGAKVSDKIAVIERLLTIADKIIVGGGMAYTFYAAQGKFIGNSLCEEDRFEYALDMLERGKDKLVLPVDFAIANDFSNEGFLRYDNIDGIKEGEQGLDSGPETNKLFDGIIKDAKTVLWNGPMGVFEMEKYQQGTVSVCESLVKSDAFTIIGGGDSAAAAIQFGYEDKINHISTGGGASLQMLEGKPLPGLDAIQDKGE